MIDDENLDRRIGGFEFQTKLPQRVEESGYVFSFRCSLGILYPSERGGQRTEFRSPGLRSGTLPTASWVANNADDSEPSGEEQNKTGRLR